MDKEFWQWSVSPIKRTEKLDHQTAISEQEHTSIDQRLLHALQSNDFQEDKQGFVAYRLHAYWTRSHWRTDTLSEYFAHDCKDVTVEDFKNLDPDARCELRDPLRNRGVYVPKGRNILISDGL